MNVKNKELKQDERKQKTQKSLFEVIKGNFFSSINEMKNTMSFVFSVSENPKNQITKDMEKYEKNLINDRKHNN